MNQSSTPNPPNNGLLDFEVAQQELEIANIKLGGRPGVCPTVLIGSIFYHGQNILSNEERGEFDEAQAAELIRAQQGFSERTGNPCMLDVVGSTPVAIQRHLEFAATVTDGPLLIDGTTTEVRLAGLEYVQRAGLSDRVVYNSIQPEISDDELQAIREAGVTSAILLTYYMMDFSAKGRVTAVRELLPKLQEAGIRHILVDTCVLDLATLGQSLSAIFDVKNQFGLPAGAGVHNAVATWHGLKGKMGRQAYEPCLASAVTAAVAVGADFVLYGPIEDAPYAFPAAAMIDTALSQVAIERGDTLPENHPRFRIG